MSENLGKQRAYPMSNESNDSETTITAATEREVPEERRHRLTKSELRADRPTWCAGCGDYGVLAIYQKMLEKRNPPHEEIVTLSGIGCSSRFPYFVNTYGVHYLHGRVLPFATGLSVARPDLNIFVFVGDGDAYSIGGNHLEHCARKNVRMTVVVMDNEVYGLTKKQTSPTSPIGFKSKTDPWGSQIPPLNPIKKLIAAGATFVARSVASSPNHLMSMMEQGMDHNGFAVIECLSECVQFYPGAFDDTHPRRGGKFSEVPADHDIGDDAAAYRLAEADPPGYFGVFYREEKTTLNESEGERVRQSQRRFDGGRDSEVLERLMERLT